MGRPLFKETALPGGDEVARGQRLGELSSVAERWQERRRITMRLNFLIGGL
jgi:hypothetical protein